MSDSSVITIMKRRKREGMEGGREGRKEGRKEEERKGGKNVLFDLA